MEITFFISLFLVFYTFIGYGLLLYVLIKIKRLIKGKRQPGNFDFSMLPGCTVIVAAYNEETVIREKILNTLNLAYPKEKIDFIFITDGSTDATPAMVAQYPEIKLLHENKRHGKIAAVHRAVGFVKTEVIIFTDANTFLNKDALVEIGKHYNDAAVGAVAGEKRVHIDENADATAGEGFYWKYESKLKKWDSELYTVVGAAGELFSIRTNLYQPVSPNSFLDDFMISMLIAEKGYRIIYEPKAYATETASANISEELKRKIRISAGGIQSILWLKSLLNPFRYPVLSFQYISHRVLRWTITPFLLVVLLVLNILIVFSTKPMFFEILLIAQLGFYLLALAGWQMERRQLRIKALFIPYYFCLMNYAVIAGIFRFIKGKQSVIWEKAERQAPKEVYHSN